MPTRAFEIPLPPTPRAPGVVTVSNCNDSGPGSLRDAAANAVDGDVIDLSALDCSTISLRTGAIVTDQATLGFVGPGKDRLTIDGKYSNRTNGLFYHQGSGTLVLRDMTLTHGLNYHSDFGVRGGCVHAQADVWLLNTDVHDCIASAAGPYGALGGAVWAGNSANIQASTISGSAAIAPGTGYAGGGGVFAYNKLYLIYSTLSDNDVRSYGGTPTFGGGAYTHGSTYLYSSAIVRNHATRWGGIAIVDFFGYDQYIANSTISENAADYVGGIFSDAELTITNSTIASNTATHGDDATNTPLGVGIHFARGTLSLYSTLVSNNTAFGYHGQINTGGAGGFDIAGGNSAVIVGSSNLVSQSPLTLPGDTIRTAALLGRVADNGGITPTQALLPGSPGVDRGRPRPNLDSDQRGDGFARTVGNVTDIGAFEIQADKILVTGFDFGPIVPTAPATFPPSESFDELVGFVPALPAGWSNVHFGAGSGWSTIESDVYSQPIAAFADDVSRISDSSLETPSFHVGANAQLSFVHHFKLESTGDATGYDGVVLEIAIDGGAFADIIDAGGSFVSGGYNSTINGTFHNPLALRQAWSGDNNDYETVVVDLPAAANGHDARLRWRIGTDSTGSFQGYWLDDVHVDPGFR